MLKTRSFWNAAVLTLACALLGVLLAKLPYLELVGTLVIALVLGIKTNKYLTINIITYK